MADVAGKATTLLRFNCFDFEKSYEYGPENPDLKVAGPEMLGGASLTNLYRMDPITDGNPIGWTIKTLGTKLPKTWSGPAIRRSPKATDMSEVRDILPELEACARELYATKRNTVKHNRGTHIFEAGNIRFGPEMRRLPMAMAASRSTSWRISAARRAKPTRKKPSSWRSITSGTAGITTMGPRNKNHRIYWDRTLVEDPLAWTLEQFETGKLRAMIERAGYPGSRPISTWRRSPPFFQR